MNWDDLRILDAVARAGSLSAAARTLGLSQPQLSRRLRGLEATVGARLFDRLPNGLTPTDAGARLIPLAADMGDIAEAVTRAGSGLDNALRGNVRISVDEVIARFLTDHLEGLTRNLPGVEFEIAADHAFANLSRREADLLIRRCLPAKGSDLIARRLGVMRFAIYAGKHYLHGNPAALDHRRYAECDWIGLAESGLWFDAEKLWLNSHLVRSPHFRTNQMTVARDAACAGQGLVLLPCFLGETAPHLARVTPPLGDIEVTLHLLVHRDVLREPFIRATANALRTLFRQERDMLTGNTMQDAAD